MKILRTAVFNCIGGNVSYGSVIPVYDSKKAVGQDEKLYILLSRQQETPVEENDCTFILQSQIDIEIIARSHSEVSKDVVDDIGNDILDLVLPTVQISGLTEPSGYEFRNLRMVNSISLDVEITQTESVLRKIITFSLQIVEQN